jgi:hypothetical protein
MFSKIKMKNASSSAVTSNVNLKLEAATREIRRELLVRNRDDAKSDIDGATARFVKSE